MKTFVLVLIGISITIQSCNQTDKNQTRADTSEEKIESLIINVEGMTCTGCENTIKANISELDGIKEVKASHIDKIVTVRFDQLTTSFESIKEKIEEKNYKVTGHNIANK